MPAADPHRAPPTTASGGANVFHTAFTAAPIGMALVSLDGTYLAVNPAFAALVGRSPEVLAGLAFPDITHPDDLPGQRDLTARLLAGEIDVLRAEKRYLRPDGEVVPAIITVSVVRDDDGRAVHLVSQVVDLTEIRRAIAAEAGATDRFWTVFEASPVGKAVLDAHGVVLRANRAFHALVGPSAPGTPLTSLVHPDDAGLAAAAAQADHPVDVRLAGSPAVVELHAASLPSGIDGRSDGGSVVQVLDVTERRAQAAALRELAEQDALTGLLNRRRVGEVLAAALAGRDAGGGRGALLLLDLDGLKYVNDTMGHAVGDDLLRDVADSLRAVLRGGDAIGRLGGDEFAIVLGDVDDAAAVGVSQAVRQAVRRHVGREGRQATVTASVGIATFGDLPAPTVDELLARADAAMYEAKRAGGDRSVLHDGDDVGRQGRAHRVEWIARLRGAVEERRLALFAQPIVPLTPGADDRPWAELLLRYRHEDGSWVTPSTFLHYAEDTGLVLQLDRWVLRQAIQALRSMPAEVRLSVNLSTASFADPDLPTFIETASQPWGVEPGRLVLELTELADVHPATAVTANLSWARRHGILLAIDDTCSGFSTFSRLHMLQPDLLKVDGDVVARLPSRRDRLILEAVARLAADLGLGLVAERVETHGTRAVLAAAGVTHGQGSLLGAPVPLEALGWRHADDATDLAG